MSTGNPYATSPVLGNATPLGNKSKKLPGLYVVIAITVIVIGSLGTLNGLTCQVVGIVAATVMWDELPEQMKEEPNLRLVHEDWPVKVALYAMNLLVNVFWIVAGAMALRRSPSGRTMLIAALTVGILVSVTGSVFGTLDAFEAKEMQADLLVRQGAPLSQIEVMEYFFYIFLVIGFGVAAVLNFLYGLSAVYVAKSEKVTASLN